MHVGDAVTPHEIDVDIKNVRAFALLIFGQRDKPVPVFGVQQVAHFL